MFYNIQEMLDCVWTVTQFPAAQNSEVQLSTIKKNLELLKLTNYLIFVALFSLSRISGVI